MERALAATVTLNEVHPNLTSLQQLDDLERLITESQAQPVLLFKHSYTCGISAEALDELITHLNEHSGDVRYAMVTVQTHRDISNAVSARLGVRHETPQALLVRDGRVVWSASHFRVNADSLTQALRTT
jgi:bacillithiol system protein YtxJ